MAEKTGAGGRPQEYNEENGRYGSDGGGSSSPAEEYRNQANARIKWANENGIELPLNADGSLNDIKLQELQSISGDDKNTRFALNDRDSLATYDKITKGGGYSIEELKSLPVFNRIQEEIEKSKFRNARRLGMPDEDRGDTSKINTPARERARERWVNDFLNGSGADTRPKTPLRKESKLTIVVGLPASGKSSRIANPLSEEKGAFILDSDEMKKLIDGFDDGKNADGVHNESKMLLDRAMTAFTEGDMKGTNIVFPVIGDSSRKTMKKIQPFIDAGYDVEIAYKKADTRESMNRVISRAIKEGRYIPRGVVMGYNNENIVNTYNEFLQKGIKRSSRSEI